MIIYDCIVIYCIVWKTRLWWFNIGTWDMGWFWSQADNLVATSNCEKVKGIPKKRPNISGRLWKIQSLWMMFIDCPTIIHLSLSTYLRYLAILAMAASFAEAVLLVLECIVRFWLSGSKQFFCGPESWYPKVHRTWRVFVNNGDVE